MGRGLLLFIDSPPSSPRPLTSRTSTGSKEKSPSSLFPFVCVCVSRLFSYFTLFSLFLFLLFSFSSLLSLLFHLLPCALCSFHLSHFPRPFYSCPKYTPAPSALTALCLSFSHPLPFFSFPSITPPWHIHTHWRLHFPSPPERCPPPSQRRASTSRRTPPPLLPTTTTPATAAATTTTIIVAQPRPPLAAASMDKEASRRSQTPVWLPLRSTPKPLPLQLPCGDPLSSCRSAPSTLPN